MRFAIAKRLYAIDAIRASSYPTLCSFKLSRRHRLQILMPQPVQPFIDDRHCPDGAAVVCLPVEILAAVRRLERR